jgi:hypothetical protein
MTVLSVRETQSKPGSWEKRIPEGIVGKAAEEIKPAAGRELLPSFLLTRPHYHVAA